MTGFAEAIRQYGLAAAASLVLAVSLLVLTLIQLRLTRRRAEQGGRDVR
jgi:alpha-1,4-digalacturonate transport system permease protein